MRGTRGSTRSRLRTAPWDRNELWRRAQAIPSLDQRFAEDKSLVDAISGQNLITFTSASSATFVGSNGVLQTAVTNLLLRSEEFGTTWTPFRATVSSNAGTAPNGQTTADTVIEDTTSNSRGVFQTVNGLISATAYTASCYVKASSRTRCRLALSGSAYPSGAAFADFNLVALTATASAGVIAAITSVGNGWYRCSIATTTGSAGFADLYIQSVDATGAANYLGNGTAALELWGAQLQQSATVGEYVPTGATINSAPRFDHNPLTGESLGLLVEEQRTNLLLRSEEFDNAYWFKNAATISANATTAPDGATTADKLVETAVNDQHFAGVLSLGLTSNIYTLSVYAKAAERTELSIFMDTSVTRRTQFFNLSTGALGASGSGITSSMQSVGNGWYKCSVTLNAAESLVNAVYSTALSGSINYLGDGTSGIYLWGAQLEAGGSPSSYIGPTTTAAVTRAASLADLINSAIVNNIRSFYVEFRSPAVGTRGVVSLNDNTANERASLLTSGTDPKLVVVDGGVTQADIDGGTVSANAVTRVAVRLGANDFAICVNGGAVVTDSSGTLPTVDRIMLGRTQAGEYLNSRIARFSGWQQSLPDSILQSLTS